MKDIQGKDDPTGAFYVLDINGPTRLVFQKQVEDILITSPDGDIFIGWDYSDPADFTKDNSLLLKAVDNLKEISKERCTHFYMMPKDERKQLRVYVTTQR